MHSLKPLYRKRGIRRRQCTKSFFRLLFRRITKTLCSTQGIQKVAVTVICRCYTQSTSWKISVFFHMPARINASRHSEGLELKKPLGSSWMASAAHTRRFIDSNTVGSPWCKSSPSVASPWWHCQLIPPDPRIDLQHAKASSRRGTLNPVQQGQPWEMGKGQCRRGKRQTRALEKNPLCSLPTHTQPCFSLPTPNLFSGLAFQKAIQRAMLFVLYEFGDGSLTERFAILCRVAGGFCLLNG